MFIFSIRQFKMIQLTQKNINSESELEYNTQEPTELSISKSVKRGTKTTNINYSNSDTENTSDFENL